MIIKKQLLVSFSGGETSAFMAQWLKANKSDEYEMIFVFANTGCENEETLEFVNECDKYFGLNVVWVEAIITPVKGVGVIANAVSFETASRNGEPFELMIKKLGIPNRAAPRCSEELKKYPIRAYARSIGLKQYYTAIGIRIDEVDRVSDKYKKEKILYPLISMIPTSKMDINSFWSKMPFRLRLKSYQGNCKWCWKKSLKKLVTIAKETPAAFDFPLRMEAKYGNVIPEQRKGNKNIKLPLTFFRENMSAKDILRMANKPELQGVLGFDIEAPNGCSESCEAF
jgi:Phosphoadenosine phosphosulfate reductase family